MSVIDGSTSASVLVVEDTLSVSTLLRAYLEQGGNRVTVAATGAQALQHLQADPPEVLVLDLNLPDLNGRQLLSEVTRRQIGCSVVVVTSDGSLQTAIE